MYVLYILQAPEAGPLPEVAASISDSTPEEEIVNLDAIQRYKDAVTDIHNVGEGVDSLNNYKDCVKRLVIPTQTS